MFEETKEDDTVDRKKKYVFDNSKYDEEDDFGNTTFGSVGLMFNLYDTFVTGNDRILSMTVPRDKDFNNLVLKFEWELRLAQGLIGEMEACAYVGQENVFEETLSEDDTKKSG